jgi:phosphopentomutase
MATAILIILDGLGVGGAPDAAAYGDAGSDTLANLAAAVGGLHDEPLAAYGRLQEVSAGKDSTTGHWELMGLVTAEPFPTYPDGFPDEVIDAFTRRTGYGVLGNKAASGTEIIQELGDEHRRTRKLIVYTSADSVFQIAAHDEVCSLEELYRVCELARELLVPPHQVSRVIARPFTGPSGAYERTPYRHDYALDPPAGLLLPTLQAHGVKVLSIGKIYDLYAGVGIDETFPSKSNAEGMAQLEALTAAPGDRDTLLLLNLVDFDMLWGHRNDPEGMKTGLEEFDLWLGSWLPGLADGTLLLLTADHGNDPTTSSTDHSREHVPVLAYLAGRPGGRDLGTRVGFMDVAATLADYFGSDPPRKGTSFWPAIRKGPAS